MLWDLKFFQSQVHLPAPCNIGSGETTWISALQVNITYTTPTLTEHLHSSALR